MKLSRRERIGLWVLGGVFVVAVALVGVIQIVGGEIGARCGDSYSCRGFLIGGAECVETERGSYCSRYCRVDGDCPRRWRCDRAYPTALSVPTNARGLICVRETD